MTNSLFSIFILVKKISTDFLPSKGTWFKVILAMLLMLSHEGWSQTCATPAPTVVNGSRCSTGTVVLSANSGTAGIFRWYAALTGGTALRTSTSVTNDSYTTVSLSATKTYYVTFHNGTCESSPRTPVVATINPVPSAPTITAASRCGAGTVTLSANSAAASTFTWYSASTGGTVLQTSAAGLTSNSYTTASLSANATYYVTVKNAIGCESTPRTAITATINAVPVAPTVTAGSTCGPGTVILAANSATAGTFKWFDAATAGNLLQTSTGGLVTNNFTTPSLSATTTYYVSLTTSAGCESATRTAVTATVNANVPAAQPTNLDLSRCGPGTVALGATSATAGTFRWYNTLTGGTLLRTSGVVSSDTYTTPSISSTTSYYVTFSNGTCESTPRRAVTATIMPAAVAPTVTNGARCGVGTVALSATSATTGTFKWYLALTGGTALRTSPALQTTDSYTTPSISASTTYYVTFTSSTGCESTPRTAVTASVTPSPSVFVLTGGGDVGLGSLSISLSGSQTGINYQLLLNGASFGAVQAGTGSPLSWTINQEGTYTVNAQVGSCNLPMTGSAIFTSGQVSDQAEFNALKDLFIATAGTGWTNKTNWPTVWPATAPASQMGTWFGVTVENGDITSVNLPSNNLVGSMPASIGNATKLRVLNMKANNITGQIPLAWSTLVNLTDFDFSNTNISGSLPPYFKNFPNLISLSITSPNLTGDIPDYSGLNNLQILGLSGNLTAGTIPDWIGTLPALTNLSLSGSNRTGSVPTSLGNMQTLTHINLSNNQLTGLLPATFVNAQNILTLNLANNQLSASLASGYFTGWIKLTSLNLSGNNFTTVPNLANNPNKANLTLAVENNLLDFPSIEPMVNQGINSYTFAPQKSINDQTSINFGLSNLIIPARPRTANVSIVWEKQQAGGTWTTINSLNQDPTQNTFKLSVPTESDEGTYRWSMTSTLATGMTLQSSPINLVYGPTIDELIAIDAARSNIIPAPVKINRNGQIPVADLAPSYSLSSLVKGDLRPVFETCGSGSFYVGFQLYYSLLDKKTTEEWLNEVVVTLLQGQTIVWSAPLQVNTKNQTFVSTAFHSQPVVCDGTYQLRIDRKTTKGIVPQESIALKVLLFRASEENFSANSTVTNFSCANSVANQIQLTGDPVVAAKEYDFEWVFIAGRDNITPANATDAFTKREPVRVTIPSIGDFSHQIFYQTGKMWCRIRAVGYNSQYPDHRVTGPWSYRSTAVDITNPELTKNWQAQTVFAEDGKNKKVVHYFDGTLRTRQSQTNLSTENITLTGETLYDFEGRKSVEILAAPSGLPYNNDLKFKQSLNTFQASDATVAANITPQRIKFNYDNLTAENSTLSTLSGAGRYYSPQNINVSDTQSKFIPDAEGYVYSQTEYLNDGTGRVRRQSGVGKEFKTDGSHATKYHYASAAPDELIRLFGNNVGNASHYKKNVVVDGNGQVSVSYHDQSDRVIASALAGKKPDNVSALPSLTALDVSPVTEDISSKNQRDGVLSVTSHKLLNTDINTPYTFTYELNGLNSQISQLCPTCKFELSITITDPDGELIDLGVIAGNEATNQFSYLKKNITSATCPGGFSQVVQIGASPNTLPLAKIGDYTITKTLRAIEFTFEEMKTLVQQSATVQAKIQQLRDSYVPDPTQCEICQTGDCLETNQTVTDVMNKVASLDCENIRSQIIARVLYNKRNETNYVLSETDIKADSDYCRYLLCVQDKASDVFEKQMALIPNWSSAVSQGYNNSLTKDPFFTEKGLSGYGYTDKMIDRLNNVLIIDFNRSTSVGLSDVNSNLRTPRPILEVLDPLNPLYYINDQGNATNSTSTGYHVLYYDLMKENPADYANQLDIQRWALYRSFYLEAKRKTKLTSIPAYATDCAKAKESLEQIDNIPQTEDGVNKWDKATIFKTTSDQQLQMVFTRLKQSCSVALKFKAADSTNIINYLRLYFDSDKNKNNFFKLIFKPHLALDGTNQINDLNLRAIDQILKTYSACQTALADAATDDPLVCKPNKTKTITFPTPAQTPNLVVNPGVSPTSDCTPYITNNGCYNGWSAKSGAPEVPYPGQNIIRLSAQRCNVTSSAVGGSISKELVPGKKYRFSVTYRSPASNQIDNVYCQLFNKDGYVRTDGSLFMYGQPSIPCSIYNQPAGQGTGGDNLLAPTCTSCMEPSAKYPDEVNVNGQNTNKLWSKQNLTNASGWTTDEVIFTATEKSTNFVFSNIPNPTPSDLVSSYDISKNLTTWGNNGRFEDGNNASIFQMFAGTNTTGIIVPDAAVNDGALGLRIKNVAGPESKGGVLLKFNAISTPASAVSINLNIRVPFGNSMSNNPNAKLFIDFPNSDWEILTRNEVTFANAPVSATLNLVIARKPGVGIVPLPDYFTISTSMKDSEANTTGFLYVDGIKVYDNPFFGERDFNGPVKSVEIKDVVIKEYYEPSLSFCIDYGTTSVPDYIAQFKAACALKEVERKSILAQVAIDNLLEDEITNFSKEFRTKCLDNATEKLKYTYVPQEYHYTLYYYDQAGNLVQTVPPEGVKPFSVTELTNYKNSPATAPNPGHRLITRYQYNSLNQLLNQTTPDAGESKFWYNDKSQLRLSQNAQQRIDSKYSYTKYDVLGRITEVGEMYTTDPVATLILKVEDPEFPIAADPLVPAPNTYLLTDVTRTYYDFANVTPQWTNLANVTAKGNTLTNTASGSWQGHAFSVNAIPANQDGYVEFRVGTGSSEVAIGLSGTDGGGNNTINYGLLMQAGSVFVVENSPAGSAINTYALTDLFRVERVGGTVYYKKNGIVFRTSTIPSTAALFTHINLNGVGSVVKDIAFAILPSPGSYASGNQTTFIQQNLRNRVAWVEVLDKGKTDATTTYYSYDIHGNVKSLLQKIPTLANKRTDYVYDLVSGKVNFVMYQFGENDQLIHRYGYDADNRITKVETSTDGFVWDKDAEYDYYLHGPLARVVLGHYASQGIDYYYTLQGWLKGVNSPTGANAQANDPSRDGFGTSTVAKDAFAYNLGYYNGDYKPIGGATAQAALIESASTTTGVWNAVGQQVDETFGLYNGNIAWMATDLASIDAAKTNRNAGVQLMQYRYDQLHRIVRSRSLTFNGSAVARTNAAYDEDYTYDANGNILTLVRNNEAGAVQDNFTYTYYTGTNKLRSVKPISHPSFTYNDAVTSNKILYKNITVKGNAYVPDNADVTLRATEMIDLQEYFRKANGKSFRAYIANDDGPYLYDAIGNLIADEEEGTQISWTPYGKVREVITADGKTISYRYDASGNRIEKRLRQIIDQVEDISQVPLPADQDVVIPTPGPASPVRYVTITQEQISTVNYTKAYLNAPESTPGLWLNGAIPVLAGERYTYRVRGYRTTACKAFLYVYGTQGATGIDVLWYTNLLPLGSANEDWTEGTFVVPAGVTSIRPGVLWDAYNQFAGETMYIREFSLTKLKKLPTIPAPYHPAGDVELLGQTINAVNYVKATVKTASSTPGLFFTAPITVKPGVQYTYRVRGYTATSGLASLYVLGVGYSDLVFNTVQLPTSAATENWVEATFTVPAAVTSVKVGVLWRLPAVGETMYIREASLAETITQDVVTHYVRDASGNVMAIYQSQGTVVKLLEQPLYGSSRLGQYHAGGLAGNGGRKEGQRMFGKKNFELSNHLGNVLTVITDNINMSTTDGVYATVVSATDYYPFGLPMAGRAVINDSYRYGFNGKEKDSMGDVVYDYGFRIYNPKIAKFLSVDPLQDMYPYSSPYAFVLNSPIKLYDPDGRFARGDKTTSVGTFIKSLKKWEVEAAAHRNSKIVGKADRVEYESENHAKLRIFDSDFRASKQIVEKVGGKNFSYNKSFGKYLDVGLPLDIAHFFKMASLAQDLPDPAVRYAYINEEFKQSSDNRPNGRTSAFSPEDLFSNELGIIFGDALKAKESFSKEFETFTSEVKTLFTTNKLSGGKYLTEGKIETLRKIAEQYYGTSDLTSFKKDSDIYKIENIKTINNNAFHKNYPFYNNTQNSSEPPPDQLKDYAKSKEGSN